MPITSARATVLTMAGTLLSFWSVLEIRHGAGLSLDLVVLAVVLGVTLPRVQPPPGPRGALAGIVVLAVAAGAASGVGGLLERHPNAGDALFVAAMAATIWVRRFGPTVTALGTLAGLPFVAVLVAPVAQPTGPAYAGGSALAAAVAYGWTRLLRWAADPTPRPAAAARPAASRTRLRASTRMAAQMAVALAAAFVLGRAAFGTHWVWPVLTAFIVGSGNRGRADVAYKGALRLAGALVGTALATPFVGLVGAGAPAAIVAIFVVLAAASWLRRASYAYWAGGVTAALAVLYGYFGRSATGLLHTRLTGILAGGAVAIVAAWVVLPVRTRDVLRRRTADALAALTEFLTADGEVADGEVAARRERFEASVAALDRLAPPLRAHRLLTRRWRPGPPPADTIDAVRRCVAPVRALGDRPSTARRTVAANVGAVRRSMATHAAPTFRDPPTDCDPALATLDGAVRAVTPP